VILADTSVWIDHLRSSDAMMVSLLGSRSILSHPYVVGEIALGTLRQRSAILAALHGLPKAIVATDMEVFQFIERQGLAGLGIGYVDAHLLASTRLTSGSSLWTRDKRLLSVAARLNLAARDGM
jgi:predicted nucleic acid-binding protein